MTRAGWNLFCQEGWPVLLECQRHGISVHIAGVFRFLYNGPTDDPPIAKKRAQWAALAEAHGVSLPAAALAFASLPSCATRVVSGFRFASEVGPTLAAAAEVVPVALWHAAVAMGLLMPG
eukprot:SAG31_NODE_8592_length_1424_cov_0.971321_2_plen_119_part_01